MKPDERKLQKFYLNLDYQGLRSFSGREGGAGERNQVMGDTAGSRNNIKKTTEAWKPAGTLRE